MTFLGRMSLAFGISSATLGTDGFFSFLPAMLSERRMSAGVGDLELARSSMGTTGTRGFFWTGVICSYFGGSWFGLAMSLGGMARLTYAELPEALTLFIAVAACSSRSIANSFSSKLRSEFCERR